VFDDVGFLGRLGRDGECGHDQDGENQECLHGKKLARRCGKDKRVGAKIGRSVPSAALLDRWWLALSAFTLNAGQTR
jgi:hypothetical protein